MYLITLGLVTKKKCLFNCFFFSFSIGIFSLTVRSVRNGVRHCHLKWLCVRQKKKGNLHKQKIFRVENDSTKNRPMEKKGCEKSVSFA